MQEISKPVTKKDHTEKINGTAKYIADMKMDGMLYGKILRSTKSHAKILHIDIPKLNDGYEVITYLDVPGVNRLKDVKSDQPIFAENEVNYIGEAILMLVGEDERIVNELIQKFHVVYDEASPISNKEEASKIFAKYSYQKGDFGKATKNPCELFTETFTTGLQEHIYLEPQGVIGVYDNDKITVYGSMQCPYYVKEAVKQAMGFNEMQVQIIQTTTGGGFGGKEDYPSLLACQAAIATYKVKNPVRLILNRREDIECTTKRHPSKIKIQTALSREGEILSMNIDITLDGGAYEGLSSVVLQRSVIAATGVYRINNLSVHGKVIRTNTVPNGAFRGFGAPQCIYAIESHMCHLAYKLKREPLEFKRKYMIQTGDETSTGGVYRDTIVLPEMIAKIEELSEYRKKRERYLGQSQRYRKGIGLSIFIHGCGFTGSMEQDVLKSVVQLKKDNDDRIEILVSNTDMGQGLKTTLSKIASNILEIPLSQVHISNPDTDRVPDSGPTVASRSLMIVGKILERAAIKLKNEFKPGVEQLIEEQYVHPNLIPWNINKFSGDAYPTYSFGVNVVELEVDTLLATSKLLGIWSVFDVGTPIDTLILQGQVEGGILQGIGYASMEKMEIQCGKIMQASMTDYIIPTANDTVKCINYFIDNPYSNGPFGAKGAGELTIIGGAPAYTSAIENALSKNFNQIPLTPEKILDIYSA